VVTECNEIKLLACSRLLAVRVLEKLGGGDDERQEAGSVSGRVADAVLGASRRVCCR
jgi:hypothetical protein